MNIHTSELDPVRTKAKAKAKLGTQMTNEFDHEAELDVESIRRRIVSTLVTYPRISPSMLQTGIGPNTKAALWKPILEQMISDGVIVRESRLAKTPKAKYRTVTILSLSKDYFELMAQHYDALPAPALALAPTPTPTSKPVPPPLLDGPDTATK
jgi:hypothetical protein